jgi:hypothetical protein
MFIEKCIRGNPDNGWERIRVAEEHALRHLLQHVACAFLSRSLSFFLSVR